MEGRKEDTEADCNSSPAMDAKHQSRAGEIDDVASDLKKMNLKSKNVNTKGNAKAG